MPNTEAKETQTEQGKSFDERVNEALNSNSASEQIKTTLLVAFELVQSFNELNEHYKKDLERFNANFDKSQALYDDFVSQKSTFEAQYSSIINNLNQNLAKSEQIKSDLDALNTSITAMSATITSQKDEIQSLVNSLNIDEINAKIADLKTKKDEITAFLPQFDAKKDELKAYLTQTKSDFEQYIADFRNDLDELDFVQTTEPNTGKKGQSWLDTSKGVINIFSQNSKIRFIQENEPQDFAKLGNGWVNNENQLFIFKAENKGNEWVMLHLNALDFDKVDFKQLDTPEANSDNEGKAWLKMSPLNVYYLENKSFVQIDKKLVRFESETQPNAESETIQLNDIWKKSDDEIFICTNIAGSEISWTPLNEAYKVAKFQRAVLPSDDEIANDDEITNDNKVQMRDLVFIVDESELYFCVKNNYSGGDFSSFEWVKKADFEANARFKNQIQPQELRQYDLWFRLNADGVNGVLKSLNTQGQMKLKSLAYVKKYADFRQEIEPSFANDGDFWYKPFSNVLYKAVLIRQAEGNRIEWVKIEPTNAIYYSGSHTVDIQLSPEEQEGLDENEHENGKITITIHDWKNRTFNGVYDKNAVINDKSGVDDKGLGLMEALGKQSLETVAEFAKPSFDGVFNLINGGISTTQTILLKNYDWLNLDNFSFYNNLIDLDDDEIFIVAKERSDFEWVDSDRADITPLLWQNELNERVKVLENLHLPNGSILQKVGLNELVVPQYPQQLANKAYVDDQILLAQIKAKTSDNVFIPCDLKEGLNFYLGKNLKIEITGDKSPGVPYSTSQTYQLVTLQSESDLQGSLEGQSGSIVVENANFMSTTLSERFVSRVGLSSLRSIEIFSYTIYNGKVYLSRL